MRLIDLAIIVAAMGVPGMLGAAVLAVTLADLRRKKK